MKKAFLILSLLGVIFYGISSPNFCYADATYDEDYQNGYNTGYDYGLHNLPLPVGTDKTPLFNFTDEQSPSYREGYSKGYADIWSQKDAIPDDIKTVDSKDYNKNGYNMGYKDGFCGTGYNNPPTALDDWKKGYHTGYFIGKSDGKDYLNGYQKGYSDASNNLPATSPVGSGKFFVKGCIDGYNAYHKEFNMARQDGYNDGCNNLKAKDLSKSTPTYQKGYRAGYDFAVIHGWTGN